MCAILDANVVHEVFGDGRHEAGKRFFDWIDKMDKGWNLVVGGKVREELYRNLVVQQWAEEALRDGRLREVDDGKVNERTEDLRDEGACRSNDPHVIALAQISGARLLYSNDQELHKDFKDKKLINGPPGKVYSTHRSEQFTDSHRRLLSTKNLCRP